jgi:hypothetical protein
MSNKEIFKCTVTGVGAPTMVQLHQNRVNYIFQLNKKIEIKDKKISDLTAEITLLKLEIVELKNSKRKLWVRNMKN